MTKDTMLLDRDNWDVLVDAAGNWALASPPYALAQDAGSAIRLFRGELWWDTTPGIPYFDTILGKFPPIALMKAQFVAAALTVPGVVSAVCFLSGIVGRKVTGQVQVADQTGAIHVVGL